LGFEVIAPIELLLASQDRWWPPKPSKSRSDTGIQGLDLNSDRNPRGSREALDRQLERLCRLMDRKPEHSNYST
jgi:hypothetical protein